MNERRKKERYINRRIIILAVLIVLYVVFVLLRNSGHLPISDSYMQGTRIFIVAVILLLIANIVIKFTEDRIFNFFRNEIELEQSIFITKIYKTAIHLVVIFAILSQLGMSTANLTLFLGLMTTGLALALRDILMSYFVWLVIILKKPFRIGDYIVHGDAKGTIIRIGTFFTTLGIHPGDEASIVKIPNKILLDKPLRNHGSDSHIVETVKLGLSSLPRGMEAKILEMNERLKKLTGAPDSCELHLDVEENEIVVAATYRVSLLEKELVRTRVIAYLASALGKHLK